MNKELEERARSIAQSQLPTYLKYSIRLNPEKTTRALARLKAESIASDAAKNKSKPDALLQAILKSEAKTDALLLEQHKVTYAYLYKKALEALIKAQNQRERESEEQLKELFKNLEFTLDDNGKVLTRNAKIKDELTGETKTLDDVIKETFSSPLVNTSVFENRKTFLTKLMETFHNHKLEISFFERAQAYHAARPFKDENGDFITTPLRRHVTLTWKTKKVRKRQ